jgi:hypothetical protein
MPERPPILRGEDRAQSGGKRTGPSNIIATSSYVVSNVDSAALRGDFLLRVVPGPNAFGPGLFSVRLSGDWNKHKKMSKLQRACKQRPSRGRTMMVYRQNRLLTHDQNEGSLGAKRANRVPGQTIFRATTLVDIPFCKPLDVAARQSKG